MVIRFFILQAQYRSTVDFSDEALQAADKALQKMLDGYRRLQSLKPSEMSSVELPDFASKCYDALDDDLNTPMVIAELFEACGYVNKAADGLITLSAEDIAKLSSIFDTFLIELLGIRVDNVAGNESDTRVKALEGAVDLLMDVRGKAKAAKDWATSDLIRDRLSALGFAVKDTKNGVEWKVIEN